MSKTNSEMKTTQSGFRSQALGALASRDLVLNSSKIANPTVGGTLISTKVVMTILSPDSDDGPFLVGVAAGGMSAADIEAALESNGPNGPIHSGQTEIATRFRHIRTLGILWHTGNASSTVTYVAYWEKLMKLGWTEQDGGYSWWLYNLGPDLVSGSTWETTEQSFVIYDRD